MRRLRNLVVNLVAFLVGAAGLLACIFSQAFIAPYIYSDAWPFWSLLAAWLLSMGAGLVVALSALLVVAVPIGLVLGPDRKARGQ